MIDKTSGAVAIDGYIGSIVPRMTLSDFLNTDIGRGASLCKTLPPIDFRAPVLASYGVDPVSSKGIDLLVFFDFVDETLTTIQMFYSLSSRLPSWIQKLLIHFISPAVPSRQRSLDALRYWLEAELGQIGDSAKYTWGSVCLVDDQVRDGQYILIEYWNYRRER